jgi:16S rRNA uridine-516 pseudouridylate synthase and related pseudouridylate synthases
MRLNRFLSSAGVCSRRKADEYIEKGYVKVNNKIVKELGVTINPDEDIVDLEVA